MTTQEKIRSMIEGTTAQVLSMLTNTIGKTTFSDAVEETQRIVNDLGGQILQIVFNEADEIFNSERDRSKVIIKHNGKTRRLLTTLGEVTLHRRLYYDKTAARYFFAADELLKIEKRARIEKGMQAQLIADATRSSYGKAAKLKIVKGENDINKGAIYENVVAQELTAHGYPCYYYNSKKLGELDFVIEHGGKVLPIEVKSGKNYKKHSALNNITAEYGYDIPRSVVFSGGNVESCGRTVYLPVYMVMFLREDSVDFADISIESMSF